MTVKVYAGPLHYSLVHVFTPKAEELRTSVLVCACVFESKRPERIKKNYSTNVEMGISKLSHNARAAVPFSVRSLLGV